MYIGKRGRAFVLTGFLCLLMAGPVLNAEESEISLTLSKLKAVESTISPSNTMNFLINNGIVRPANCLNFSGTNPGFTDIIINETVLQMMYKDKKFGIRIGEKTKTLEIKEKAIQPIELPLMSGEKYVLAFPFLATRGSYASVGFRSGSVQKGLIGTETIALYDDNLDGLYQQGKDAWQLSPGPLFAPLEAYLCGKDVYRLSSIKENGSGLSYETFAGPVGELGLKYKGPATCKAYAVYTASVEGGKASVILSGSNQKVPLGNYALQYGVLIASGKVVCGIITGESKEVEVTAEKAATAALGDNLFLTFTPSVTGGKLEISPQGIKVNGPNGEQYRGFEFDGKPEVLVVNGQKSEALGSFSYG